MDTVIKDLVFRIEPPLLKEVIHQRVRFALRRMPKVKGQLTYTLPNGMIVEYPASDQGRYLASILRSLFENTYFSRLITGLAGRDIRKGLEIFLDFCKSGHISETEIFKIKQSEGTEILPNYIVSRVLLRGGKKYYVESSSIVKNLFHSDPAIDQPNPFNRLAILLWLKLNYKRIGTSKISSYHKVTCVFSDLVSIGFMYETLESELRFLIKNKLVFTESQSEEDYSAEELIAIAPAGLMHLELLNDISYFAACAEDVWYNNLQIAETIAKRISEEIGKGIYSQATTIENANDLILYLKKYKDEDIFKAENFLESNVVKNYIDLSKSYQLIRKAFSKLTEENKIIDYSVLEFKPSQIVECQVVSIQSYGVIVEFGLSSIGLIHIHYFRNYMSVYDNVETGDILDAEVLEYKKEHEKYNLRFIPS